MDNNKVNRKFLILIGAFLIIVASLFLVKTIATNRGRTLTIKKADTVELGKDYKKVVIKVPGVILKDGEAEEIIIESSVEDGEVTLQNVNSDKLYIHGGGTESIFIAGTSEFKEVYSKKTTGTVRIFASDKTNLKKLIVDEDSKNVIIEGLIKNLEIRASSIDVDLIDANLDIITLAAGVKRTKLNIDEASKLDELRILNNVSNNTITVSGDIGKTIIDGKNNNFNILGKVKEFLVRNKSGFTIAGLVEEFKFVSGSENSELEVTKDGKITLVRSEVNLKTSGNGLIQDLIINKDIDIDGTIRPRKTTVNNDPINHKLAKVTKPISKKEEPKVEDILVDNVVISTEDDITTILVNKGTLQLNSLVKPAGATNNKVSWSVNNKEIAKIDPKTGLLTAIKNGEVEVTLTSLADETIKDTIKIKITGYYDFKDGEITKYYSKGSDDDLDEITELVIPSKLNGEEVTSIGKDAFEESNLKSITLPETVTVIKEAAFKDNTVLENVTLNEGLVRIEKVAFMNTGLVEITLPEGLAEIQDNAFNNSINKIKIASDVNLGENVFADNFKIIYNILSKKAGLYKYELTEDNVEVWTLDDKDLVVPTPVITLDKKLATNREEGIKFEIDAIENVTYYYTLDGSEPTSDSTLYEGPVTLPAPDADEEVNITIKVIGVANYFDNSKIAEDKVLYAAIDTKFIDNINLVITGEITAGKKTEENNLTVTPVEGYTAEISWFFKGHEGEVTEFITGFEYEPIIKLIANDDYLFKDEVTVTINEYAETVISNNYQSVEITYESDTFKIDGYKPEIIIDNVIEIPAGEINKVFAQVDLLNEVSGGSKLYKITYIDLEGKRPEWLDITEDHLIKSVDGNYPEEESAAVIGLKYKVTDIISGDSVEFTVNIGAVTEPIDSGEDEINTILSDDLYIDDKKRDQVVILNSSNDYTDLGFKTEDEDNGLVIEDNLEKILEDIDLE